MSAGSKHDERVERGSLARLLILVVPLFLPFETPLFPVGPIVITSAELAIYIALAGWGIGLCAAALRAGSWRGAADRFRDALVVKVDTGPGIRDGLGLAVALWLTVIVASAVLAPAHRDSAVKFALRAMGGILLFFAARDLLRSEDDVRRVAVAVLAGAALSAAMALLENVIPASAVIWEAFRSQGFDAVGLQRASGTFGYPTIAAMYWEAALPLAIVLPVSRSGPGRDRPLAGIVLGLALAALLIEAILHTVTRAGLMGSVLASSALLILGWRAGRHMRVVAGGALAMVPLFVAITVLSGRADARFVERLLWWNDDTWYRARYELQENELTMHASAVRYFTVTVENQGSLVWPHTGVDAVFLSYHWETVGQDIPSFEVDGQRTALDDDVLPGGQVTLTARVRAPDEPGSYQLRWDMVREHVTWFSQAGTLTGDQDVEVVPGPTGPPKRRRSARLRTSFADWLVPAGAPRPELWRAAVLLWWEHPLLGVGPDNFRRRYIDVIAPEEGTRKKYDDDRLHANNLYFETLADLGLCGLAALAAIVVAFLQIARTRARPEPRSGLLGLACSVAAGTFFVHGILDYFLEFTPTYALFWLLLALAGGAWPALAPGQAPRDSRS